MEYKVGNIVVLTEAYQHYIDEFNEVGGPSIGDVATILTVEDNCTLGLPIRLLFDYDLDGYGATKWWVGASHIGLRTPPLEPVKRIKEFKFV